MLHDGVDVDDSELEALRAAGVDVVDGRVRRIVTGDDGHVAAVELADGDRIDADAVVVGPRFRVRAEPFASLGLETAAHPTGLGDFVETDATGATAVPGLYAAGNVTDPSQQVLQAAANGSRVGAMISFSLADDDIRAAARPSANEADWDHRYGGDQMWSGNPNGTLVNEISGLTPGRALDVGAGEGGDALWLAEQGWSVTASDISQRALDRVAAEAERRGCTRRVPPRRRQRARRVRDRERSTSCRPSTHRSPARPTTAPSATCSTRSLPAARCSWSATTSSRCVRRSTRTTHSRPFDPDAYVRVDDFAAALADSPDWDIEVHEKRPRPPGAASASHHVDDIVLRARRRAG